MTVTPIDERTPGATAPAALVALMSNVIDYAGLFPPAELDMATTVANYARFVGHSHAWMLERLVVPVARLDEMETAAATLLPTGSAAPGDDPEPWPISALTRPAGDPGLAEDLERIAVFNAKHAEAGHGHAVIDTIELRGPTAAAIDDALDLVPDDIFPFFEISAADDPRGLVAALVGGEAGAKLRTGGVTPGLFPSPPDVARFIAVCAAAGVAFKATAGLHHPVRHHDAAVGADAFGFLNVFVAAALADMSGLDETALLPVLEEREAGAFTFDDTGLAWRDHRVDVEAVEDARLTFAVSFGSCSFDEPREDLRALDLLR